MNEPRCADCEWRDMLVYSNCRRLIKLTGYPIGTTNARSTFCGVEGKYFEIREDNDTTSD